MDNLGFQTGLDPSKCVTETSFVNGKDTSDSHDKNANVRDDRDTRNIDGQTWGTSRANENHRGAGNQDMSSRALDGGWGWMVVLGAFLLHTLGNGMDSANGIMYLELLNRFNKSAIETTWVLMLSSSIGFLGGPLVGGLCDRLSCRAAGYIGALMSCVGLLISGFVPSLTYMYITYGILTGFGRSITYASSLVSVGLYFDTRIGLAVGFSTAGSGAGSFAFPPLVELLFVTYGFQGAFMLMAVVFSHAFVAASLFLPLRTIPNLKQDVGVVYIDALPESNGTVHQDQAKFKSDLPDSCKKHECRSPLDCQLLRHYVFTATCIQMLFHHMAKQAAFMFLPALAVSKGISVAEAALIISAAGICECVSKFVTTIILDLKPMRRFRLAIYCGVVILMGVVAASLQSLTNFLQLAVASSIYGILSGTRSQKNIAIIDTVKQERFSGAMGWMFLFQGVGSIMGPTIAAAFKDYYGDYAMAIYIGALGHVSGGLVMVAGVLHFYFREQREKCVV